MTQTTIPLIAGRNYISFPATSSDNFGTIFTISEIKDGVTKFFTYDTILGYTDVSDFEYIERGKGYILDISFSGYIIYEGIEYTLTFDQLESRIMNGWNLIGPGSTSIISSNWCRVIDATTGFSVTILEPTKSYWINYNECIKPMTDPFLSVAIMSLGISLISLFLAVRGTKTYD